MWKLKLALKRLIPPLFLIVVLGLLTWTALQLPEQLDNLFLPLSTIIEFTRNGEAEKTKSN